MNNHQQQIQQQQQQQSEVSECLRNMLDAITAQETNAIIIDDDDDDDDDDSDYVERERDDDAGKNPSTDSYFSRPPADLLSHHSDYRGPVYGPHRPLSPVGSQEVGVVHPTLTVYAEPATNQAAPFPAPMQIVAVEVRNEQPPFSPVMIGPLVPNTSTASRIICPQVKVPYSEPEVHASRLHRARINASQRLADFLIKEKLSLQKEILEKSKELHSLKAQVKEMKVSLRTKLDEGFMLAREYYDARDKAKKPADSAQKTKPEA